MVLLAHRKLFAKGFLSGLAPWFSLPTGNCWRRVSCPPWLHGISYRQETVRERFPVHLVSMVFLTHGKLFAKGFLFGLIPQCFLPTGNYSHIVSHSAWLHGVSCPQETVGERFPVRLDSTVFLTDRKLFAYSFLSDLASWRFLPTGNCWRKVSCPPWLHGVSYHRKLFAYSFPFDLAPWRFLPTGNCSPIVSHSTWLHGVSYPQETVRL